MKHIRLYLFVLFIACSMFMVCPFAHAESMPSNVKDYLLEDMDTFFTNWRSYSSQIDTITSQCPYFVRYSVTIGSGNYTMYEFYKYENLGINSVFINNYYYSEGMNESGSGCVFTKDSSLVLSSTGVTAYRFLVYNRTTLYYILSYTCTSTTSSVGAWFPGARFFPGEYSYYLKPVNASVASSSFSVNISNAISCGNLYVNTARNTYSLVENTAPQYTEDERLKLYKLWSSQNGDSLVVDLSAFRSYTPAAAYEFSDIVITLTTNGVDIDYNLPLSSSTINNGWDNNSNLYTISTPVSDFTLSDTYDTYITKVSFSLDVSSPGGSGSTPFYISTNFPLDVHHSSITPGAVPTPATIYDDPANPIDISDRQYDFFQQLQSSVMGGDIVYVNNYPVLPSWANVYNLNTFFYDNNPDDLHIYLGTQITGAFRAEKYNFDIKAFLYDNASSNFYDVVIIRIDDTEWPMIINNNTIPDSQSLYGYVVLYTDSYYKRLDAETQFNILQALQLDANQQLANWSWLVAKLDDFESKSLEILNPLYDETTYIDDKLASILYAVNNIESYNDSSIVSLLTDIKGLLSSPENEIDTPQECIQLYEAHPNYFDELWGTSPSLRSASRVSNPFSGSEYVRSDLVPAWWEGKTLTMIYLIKNDGSTSRFYNDMLNGLYTAYDNLISSNNAFNDYINSLFKYNFDYSGSFYGHLFSLDYNPEDWSGGFNE